MALAEPTRHYRPFARPESSIERSVCDKAYTDLGVRNIKINTTSESGYPDRMFFIPGGLPFLIEFKKPGKRLEKKQSHVHDQLKADGYDVEWHDTKDGALKAIRLRLERPHVRAFLKSRGRA